MSLVMVGFEFFKLLFSELNMNTENHITFFCDIMYTTNSSSKQTNQQKNISEQNKK